MSRFNEVHWHIRKSTDESGVKLSSKLVITAFAQDILSCNRISHSILGRGQYWEIDSQRGHKKQIQGVLKITSRCLIDHKTPSKRALEVKIKGVFWGGIQEIHLLYWWSLTALIWTNMASFMKNLQNIFLGDLARLCRYF